MATPLRTYESATSESRPHRIAPRERDLQNSGAAKNFWDTTLVSHRNYSFRPISGAQVGKILAPLVDSHSGDCSTKAPRLVKKDRIAQVV